MLDFTVIWKTFGRLATSVPYTITIAFVSILLSTALAILLSMVKIKKVKIAGALVELYLSFFRSTPGLIHILLVYYGLPLVLKPFGIILDASGKNIYSIAALSLSYAANLSEILRPAYLSIDKGQHEAALCAGLNSFQKEYRIILPQVMPIALPAMGNAFIELITIILARRVELMKIFVEDLLSIITVVPRTLGLALIVMSGSFLAGLVIAAAKMSHNKALNMLSRFYIWYVRGIPLIVHLFILYYLFPKNAPVTAVLIVTYVLYSAPGQAENIRTAIQSVPKGQYEAAYCSGLSSFQTFRRIIFPQALTVLLPISLTVYLGNIKGMSVAFMIGVVDIMSQAKLCSALNFGYVEAYLAAAVVYWVLCVGLTKLFTSCETILYRKKGIAVS